MKWNQTSADFDIIVLQKFNHPCVIFIMMVLTSTSTLLTFSFGLRVKFIFWGVFQKFNHPCVIFIMMVLTSTSTLLTFSFGLRVKFIFWGVFIS